MRNFTGSFQIHITLKIPVLSFVLPVFRSLLVLSIPRVFVLQFLTLNRNFLQKASSLRITYVYCSSHWIVISQSFPHCTNQYSHFVIIKYIPTFVYNYVAWISPLIKKIFATLWKFYILIHVKPTSVHRSSKYLSLAPHASDSTHLIPRGLIFMLMYLLG